MAKLGISAIHPKMFGRKYQKRIKINYTGKKKLTILFSRYPIYLDY